MASFGQIVFGSMITLIVLFSAIIIFVLALTFSNVAPEVTTHDMFPVGNIGADQLLTCNFHKSDGESKITRVSVSWEKVGMNGFVYHYLDGGPDLRQQNPEFQGRVELFPSVLMTGNASLLLRHVRSDDKGVYTCRIDSSDGGGKVNIQLRTAAYTAPDFIFSNGIMTAMATRWFPKPTVTWMDHNQNILPGKTNLTVNSAGIFSVHSTLQPINVSETYTLQIGNELVTAVSRETIIDLNVSWRTYFIFSAASSQVPSTYLSILSTVLGIFFLM